MTLVRIKRLLAFWSFVFLGAYFVYVYPIDRLLDWFGWPDAVRWYSAIALWLLAVASLRLMFSGRLPWVRPLLINWLGVGFIFFSLCVIFEIVRWLTPVSDKTGAVFILAFGGLLVVAAIVIAQRFAIRRFVMASNKLRQRYRVVQLSDVHIGSRRSHFMRRIVTEVNALEPTHVVITGDLVDTSRVGHEELRALADIAAPVYFVVGNHDRYVDLDRLLPVLSQLDIIIIRNDRIDIDCLQFIGIDDADDPNQVKRVLPGIDMDESRFRILLYHRPQGWQVAVDSGIELMLSGHTHNGQIIPFNWLVKQQFPLIKGLHKDGMHHLYVSTGTGTWGPVMRLGSRNEIVCIDLHAEGV